MTSFGALNTRVDQNGYLGGWDLVFILGFDGYNKCLIGSLLILSNLNSILSLVRALA